MLSLLHGLLFPLSFKSTLLCFASFCCALLLFSVLVFQLLASCPNFLTVRPTRPKLYRARVAKVMFLTHFLVCMHDLPSNCFYPGVNTSFLLVLHLLDLPHAAIREWQ
jgi:hypothetical protein